MSFETLSLLLNWMEMGVLLAILFRLGRTFELIANTQRELRRAIHNLDERRTTERGITADFGNIASPSSPARAGAESAIDPVRPSPSDQLLNACRPAHAGIRANGAD